MEYHLHEIENEYWFYNYSHNLFVNPYHYTTKFSIVTVIKIGWFLSVLHVDGITNHPLIAMDSLNLRRLHYHTINITGIQNLN